jgi:hypothetical protein
MSEINFILNISQTFVILWGSDAWRSVFSNVYVFLFVFFGGVVASAVIVGGYAIKNVDPTLSMLNPFAQDMVKQRKTISRGLYLMTQGDFELAAQVFKIGEDLTEKWIE